MMYSSLFGQAFHVAFKPTRSSGKHQDEHEED